jgi:Spy/CpxP family protein refolding chaperone
MRSIVMGAGGLVLLTAIGIYSLGGCATGITANTTLADAAEQLAQLVAEDPTLSTLTVGDLAAAYQSYVAELLSGTTADATSNGITDSATGVGHRVPRPAGLGREPSSLSADELAQLQTLQAQLAAGAITQDEFVTQIQSILGDAAATGTSGTDNHGGPRHGHLAGLLNLTTDQQTQADAIFAAAETDIRALRDEAREQIRALLTTEQLAIFDELCPPPPDPNTLPDPNLPPPPPGGPGMGPHRAMGPGHGMGPHGAPSSMPVVSVDDPNAPADGPDAWLDEQLQLTDEQQTQIDAIRTALHDAVAARHEQARTEFRAILTADQITILDQWEAAHPRPE